MESTKMRAKFTCHELIPTEYGVQAKFWAVYGGETNEEDNQFSEATPSGQLEMLITNPSAYNFLEAGQNYYLDFTKAN